MLTLYPYVIIEFRDLDHPSLPQGITLAYYTDYINAAIYYVHNEQEVVPTPDLLVGHLHITAWEINQTKIQGHSTSLKF